MVRRSCKPFLTRFAVVVFGATALLGDGGVVAARAQTEPEPYDRNIYLRSRVLEDPGLDRKFVSDIQDSSRPVHGIVQLHALPRPGDIAVLAKLNIRPLEYLNGMTGTGTAYLASVGPGLPTEDRRFERLVRAVQPLETVDKTSPELLAEATEAVAVAVLFFSDVDPIRATEVLEETGVQARRLGESLLYEGRATSKQVRAMADRDEVQWVSPAQVPRLTLDDVRAASRVDAVQQLQPTGVYAGLTGQGVQIAIMDTGVDSSHDDLRDRMIRVEDDGAAGHGTGVAGVAAGNGVRSNMADDAGVFNGGAFREWRGMAPEAGIAAYPTVNSNPSVFSEAIKTFGVDVSNHSYGMGDFGEYSAEIQAFDRIIRGGFPGLPGRPAVNAVANNASVGPADCDGDGSSDPGTNFPQYPSGCPTAFKAGYFSLLASAKNSIGVASVLKNSLVHTPSSSIGPTNDGRLKPDVAAIGDGLISTCADTLFWPPAPQTPRGCNGNANPGPGNGYSGFGGTSAASPAVAGVVALLLEQYAAKFGVDLDTAPPLPSTSKVILIQTARDLVGVDPSLNFDTGQPTAYGAGPDWATGYGLVDAEAAVRAVAEGRFLEAGVSEASPSDTHAISVVPGQAELRVTLAWDDRQGTPNSNDAARQLVNDLDLVLFGPNGQVHRPLVLPLLRPRDCDASAAGIQVRTCIGQDDPTQNYLGAAAQGTDSLNNVEQVVIPNPTPGQWRARVSVLNPDGTVRLPFGGIQRYSLAGVSPGRADLSATKAASTNRAMVGEDLTYTITVRNHGPHAATDVAVADQLPPNAALKSVASSQGTCGAGSGVMRCSLGTINHAATATVTVVVRTTTKGPLVNAVRVFSTVVDPDPANNHGVAATDVLALTGGAFGIRAQVSPSLLPPQTVGPTPSVEVPPGGGAAERSQQTMTTPLGLASATAMGVFTHGGRTGSNFEVYSSADTARASLAGVVSVEGLHSECRANLQGAHGSTRITSLLVLGQPFNVPASAQTINIPGVGVLTLNEQIKSSPWSITINALHLKLNGGLLGKGDLILSQSRCGLEF